MDRKRSDKHSIVQVIVLHRFGCLIEKNYECVISWNIAGSELRCWLRHWCAVTQVNNESFSRARVRFPRFSPAPAYHCQALYNRRWDGLLRKCVFGSESGPLNHRVMSFVICRCWHLSFLRVYGDLFTLDGNLLGWLRSTE